MVVCPAGLQGAGLIVDGAPTTRAHTAPRPRPSRALRRAGINTTGQVRDRNPSHAVEDALALFPARTGRRGRAERSRPMSTASIFDADELRRERGIEPRVREPPAE